MPTYIYERQESGERFETFQMMKDDPLETCPKTGEKVKRVITGGVKPQIKNKQTTMAEQKNKEAQARENKTTTLGEYGNIMERQQKKWEEKKRDKK